MYSKRNKKIRKIWPQEQQGFAVIYLVVFFLLLIGGILSVIETHRHASMIGDNGRTGVTRTQVRGR